MELFTVQQIIGCGDETILAAGTGGLHRLQLLHDQRGAGRRRSHQRRGPGLSPGLLHSALCGSLFLFFCIFILQKRRRAL